MKTFDVNNAFNRLASDSTISLPGLRLFCRHNGVYFSLSDCDSLLRRFDHNGNSRLEFDEFYELITGFDLQSK